MIIKGAKLFSLFLTISLLSSACSNTHPPSFSHISNPEKPFKVRIRSTQKPLKSGQLLQLELLSLSNGFVNLYTVSSSGKVASLLENQYVKGGEALYFPNALSEVDYRVSLPLGTETYILIVSRKKLNWIAYSDRLNNHHGLTYLNLTKTQLIQRLEQAVSRFSKDDWSSDYLQLQIVK